MVSDQSIAAELGGVIIFVIFMLIVMSILAPLERSRARRHHGVTRRQFQRGPYRYHRQANGRLRVVRRGGAHR